MKGFGMMEVAMILGLLTVIFMLLFARGMFTLK